MSDVAENKKTKAKSIHLVGKVLIIHSLNKSYLDGLVGVELEETAELVH